MLSRFVGAALVLFAIGGFVLAGEYTGCDHRSTTPRTASRS